MSLLLLLTGTGVRCGQKSWGLQCEAIGVFLQLLGKCEPQEIIDCEGLCTVLKFCLLFSASKWVMLWSTEAARHQWHSSYRDQLQTLSHCRQYLQFAGIALLSGGMAEQLHSKRRYSSVQVIGKVKLFSFVSMWHYKIFLPGNSEKTSQKRHLK